MHRSTFLLCSCFVLLVGLFSLTIHPVRADTVITNCTQADLQTALNSGGMITFNCGTSPVTIDLTSTLTVPIANTTVDGGNTVTLKGNGSVRLLLNLTTLTLKNLTLTKGSSGSGPGGAIYNGGTLVLDHVLFTDNAVPTDVFGGGAIYNLGYLYAHNSTFSNNSSTAGGAMYNDVGAVATLDQNSQLTGNRVTGPYGGAIMNAGTMTLTDVLVSSNVLTVTSFEGGGAGLKNGVGNLSLTNVTVDGNTIVGGNSRGGGIHNAGTLAMWGGSITNNRVTGYGGGVFDIGTATSSYVSVTLSNNQAGGGGGGMYGTHVLLSGLTISGNSAGNGGGLRGDDGSSITVLNSTFDKNTADSSGGAFFIDLACANITSNNNTYTDNSARYGGAVATWCVFNSQNDTFSGNHASTKGGGIQVWSNVASQHGTLSLRNVTLNGNAAPSGGGLSIDPAAVASITNTVIANSPTGGNCAGPSITSKYSLTSDNTCVFVGTGNSINPNVRLSPLGDYGGPTLVHMPLLGSPVVDGVSGSDAPTVDQRGKPRPVGAVFDIGSVERQANDPNPTLPLFLPLLLR